MISSKAICDRHPKLSRNRAQFLTFCPEILGSWATKHFYSNYYTCLIKFTFLTSRFSSLVKLSTRAQRKQRNDHNKRNRRNARTNTVSVLAFVASLRSLRGPISCCVCVRCVGLNWHTRTTRSAAFITFCYNFWLCVWKKCCY